MRVVLLEAARAVGCVKEEPSGILLLVLGCHVRPFPCLVATLLLTLETRKNGLRTPV